MTEASTPRPSRRDDTLDPDALALLEEQRDFLLRSLEDLEREHDAGDVDEDDYRTLRDDYTHRAAMALRAIELRQSAREAATAPRSMTRLVLGVIGVVLFAGLVGMGVARAAGDRLTGEGLTGGVRASVGQRLFNCQELAFRGEILDSIECYDDVLDEQPANREAMSYKGWTLVLAGLPQLGWPYLEEAVRVDAEYPDARAFRAIVLSRWCRPEEVLAELDAFERSRPLAEMRALIEGAQLREMATELLAVRRDEPTVADAPAMITQVGPEDYDQCSVLADAGILERLDQPED